MKAKSRLSVAISLLALACACGTVPVAHTSSPSPAAASSSIPRGVIHSESMVVGGATRTFHVFVPTSLDPGRPAPLMLILHPCPATTGAVVAVRSGLNDVATANRFIAVYPEGAVMAATGGTCWNAGACCTGADDVAFVSALIDQLESQLKIDKARVFAAGFSFGASMTYRLACELSDKIAAIAPVSGSMVFSDCRPTRPVSVLIMHGTADATFPYLGGGDYSIPPVADVARLWATLDHCGSTPAVTHSGITTTTDWNSCQAGADVRLEVIAGAPHTWFGLEPDPLPGEPNASATVWSFFAGLTSR